MRIFVEGLVDSMIEQHEVAHPQFIRLRLELENGNVFMLTNPEDGDAILLQALDGRLVFYPETANAVVIRSQRFGRL